MTAVRFPFRQPDLFSQRSPVEFVYSIIETHSWVWNVDKELKYEITAPGILLKSSS